MNRVYHLIKLRFCVDQNAGYFNIANQSYYFLISFKKIASKIDKHIMLSIYHSSTNALNLIFFNSIQNSHVHEPSKLIENVQHLHILREKPNLKSLS